MRPNRRSLLAAAIGVLAVAAYLAAAGLTGHLGPHGGRLLFDGFAPPPPYRWVKPPPDLAGTNQQPQAATATVQLGADGSAGASVLTPDSQAFVFLVEGAIPAKAGQRSVLVTIEPLAPPTDGTFPGGLGVDGNVYRFTASYQPSGEPVTRLAVRSTIVLVYPVATTPGHYDRALMRSDDQTVWRSLTTSNAAPQLQAAADVDALGYYAVGRTKTGEASGGLPSWVRSGVFVLLLVAALVVLFLGWRRRRSS